MESYNPIKIEKKWRKIWEKKRAWKVDIKKAKRPYYNLMMFPYPSAEGLHMGNVFAFTGSDIYGRYMRMKGHDVFEPMGFDAFGIHSENFAIKQGTHPKSETEKNVGLFREQLKKMGAIFDWDHEVDTSSPKYYKWTQWLFLQMYKAGLAYRAKAPVDWCPGCKTVLADEQVIGGKCERCDSVVEQKELEQWFLKITKYAEKLLNNLEALDWSRAVKTAQRNWIGRSEGAELEFGITNNELGIRVFTTRPDTLFGATYLVLSPEHHFVNSIIHNSKFIIQNLNEIQAYISASKKKTELERTDLAKGKTGVELKGIKAINPANNEEIPVWIADYVLQGYGTGAIMAVPAHDERDREFAEKFNLPIRQVTDAEAKEAMSRFAKGNEKINYHLRDWLISRQRYWGPPIPVIYCNECGAVPVPEKDLPVELPYVENFRPTGTDKSPLAAMENFVKSKCPTCGGEARRETDISDNFLDSSWYFLRYPSSDIDKKPFDETITKKWLPVDMYIGGKEHSVLHLMYARFITMALHDMGLVDFDEPFRKFRAHGLLIKGGAKMSKSRGNVVSPDEYFESYGVDALRMYLMFLGPYEQGGDWQDRGIVGVSRFLKRVWVLVNGKISKNINKDLEKITHKTIKKVTEDVESLQYNTAISTLMEFANKMTQYTTYDIQYMEVLLKLLAPFAPHITEELWEKLGHKTSIHDERWPEYDPEKIKEKRVRMAVEVNGKVRAQIEVSIDAAEDYIKEMALKDEKISKWLEGKAPQKVIVVPRRVVSIVV
ncbi:MAG: class I tRNA ligase family protein [Candidatus Spechtbacterales bacterium]